MDLLDARPDDATIGHRGGPTQGELDHRQRQGFGFRYDYFGARQITLQFANVQPDVEYLFGLSKLGDRRGVLAHDDYKHTDWGDGFRDPCCWRIVFTRAMGLMCPATTATSTTRRHHSRSRRPGCCRRSRPRGHNATKKYAALWPLSCPKSNSDASRKFSKLAYRHTRLTSQPAPAASYERPGLPRASKMQFVGGNFTLKKNGP